MPATAAYRIVALATALVIGACTDPSLDPPLTTLVEGNLVITEIMADPAQVADANGEWFEIHNRTRSAVQLRGLIFKDDGTDNDTVNVSLIVQAGRYAVFARDSVRATNGGVIVSHVYSGFSLASTADEIELILGGIRIDRVAYGAGYPLATGIALALTPAATHLSNDSVARWCAATTPYGAGDLGTPFTPNPAC